MRLGVCKTCQRATNDAFICRRCGIELHDLLVGSREPDGQPGIVWYLGRLRESAYGQTKLARPLGAKSAREGYALLVDKRAVQLLGEITRCLARWEAITEGLRALHSPEMMLVHTGTPERAVERLDVRRARYIAVHARMLRHHCRDVHRLQAELMSFARRGWSIINRPDDICCGPCPSPTGEPCGTLLYALEGASTVRCPNCHAVHDVSELREALRAHVKDMLFTGPELRKLMETRLNDHIPKSTFNQLIRDGRLKSRRWDADCEPMFTYDDVCEAREKPKPARKVRAS